MKGSRYDDGNPVKKMAYRPSAGGMAAMGAIRDAVDTIAAGVEKGMRALLENPPVTRDSPDGVGGGGLINASYSPGGGGGMRARFGGGGAGGSVDAASIAAVHAKGSLAKNQKIAYDTAISEGLSSTAARALVANMSGEALSDPRNTTGDHGTTQGIVQWHRDRAERIRNTFGKLPYQMGVADQTKAAIWEIKQHYPSVWKALQGGGNAESMIDSLVRTYEAPGNPGKSIAQRLAFLKGLAKDLQEANSAKPDRPSLATKSGAIKPQDTKPPTGKVDIHVHSKDQPVTIKDDGSPLFREMKVNRGRNMPQIDA